MIIDPQSSKPVFEQIANQLRRQILSGVFKPNESLPSLRRLAKEIRVNPNTVQRAYDELSREGLVEARRGAGLFVIVPDSNSPRTRSEERLSKELQQAIAKAVETSVSPQRIRGIFRDALETQLSEAQKSR